LSYFYNKEFQVFSVLLTTFWSHDSSSGGERGIRQYMAVMKYICLFFVGRSQEEGKKQREDEEGGRSRDSPLPLHCSLEDLLQLIEAGQDMRKITKVIKMLCNSEDALRCVLLFFYLFFFLSEMFRFRRKVVSTAPL
jgi:hypothetical protein